MLAIHLNRDIHEKGFKPNKQDHVTPILATTAKAELNSGTVSKDSDSKSQEVCTSKGLLFTYTGKSRLPDIV